MATIRFEQKNGKKEKTKKLSDLKTGDVFRFAEVPFDEAVKPSDKTVFWKVVNIPPAKAERKSIISLDGETVAERDGDRLVIVHPVDYIVRPAELVTA